MPKGVVPAPGDWLRRQQPPRRRMWALEEQLLGPAPALDDGLAPRRAVIDLRPTQAELDRDYRLCRCEGFAVESPSGHVGFVEGLRFRSRVDLPDLLEVSAGLLGRRTLLIPVAGVETIESEEEVLVLREDPVARSRRTGELVARLGQRIQSTLF